MNVVGSSKVNINIFRFDERELFNWFCNQIPWKKAYIRKLPSKIYFCIWHCPRLENWWQQGQLIGKCSKFNVLEIVVQCYWAMFSSGSGALHHKKKCVAYIVQYNWAIGQCLERNVFKTQLQSNWKWHYTPFPAVALHTTKKDDWVSFQLSPPTLQTTLHAARHFIKQTHTTQ